MLKKILSYMEDAKGPVSLEELGRELSIELDALRGMIEFWQRKGKLTLTQFGENGFVYQGGTCTACKDVLACSLSKEFKTSQCKF